MKDKRKDHAAMLFNNPRHFLELNMFWFFLDEKKFCLYQMANSQNNRWLAFFPQDVSVFGVVTSDGDVMSPFIFSQLFFRLNTKAYIKCLWKVLFSGSRYWLLEDPTFCNRRLHQEEPFVGCQKMSKPSLTSKMK